MIKHVYCSSDNILVNKDTAISPLNVRLGQNNKDELQHVI